MNIKICCNLSRTISTCVADGRNRDVRASSRKAAPPPSLLKAPKLQAFSEVIRRNSINFLASYVILQTDKQLIILPWEGRLHANRLRLKHSGILSS